MAISFTGNSILFSDNTSLSSGIITAAQLSAGAVAQSFTNTSGAFSFRNKIINGNFDIWQRGTSFNTFTYGADRWLNVIAGSSCTMSRQNFTLGQTNVPNEPTFFCRMTVTSVTGASNAVNLTQRIEDVRTLAGKQAVLTFYAKADTNRTISVDIVQSFGTGGSPSTQVSGIGTRKINVNTSWQKITIVANIPQLSPSAVFGTNNDSFLGVRIWFDAGSSFNALTDTLGHQSGTFDIAQVQLEEGPYATAFEQRTVETELSLCYRYYFASPSRIFYDTIGSGYNNLCSIRYAYHIHGHLPVVMRRVPTLTLAFETWNGSVWTNQAGNFTSTTGSNVTIGPSNFDARWRNDVAGFNPVASGQGADAHITYTANAEI